MKKKHEPTDGRCEILISIMLIVFCLLITAAIVQIVRDVAGLILTL